MPVNHPRFQLGDREVGVDSPALIVAEIAQAHDGSLGTAHAYIDAVAKTGADVIKFQTHIADAESTPAEPWRVRFSHQDSSRFEYWKRMEFTPEQWLGLYEHATEKGLIFLSSPFSDEAVDLLNHLGVVAWKVASGEVDNPLLLEKMARTGKPMLLSSGMSSLACLDDAVSFLRNFQIPLAIFQCTTAYPCPPQATGLRLIAELRQRYGIPAGLSDHSGTIYPALAAAALGVELLEIHVTFHRELFGPDVPASVTIEELKQLVEGVRFIETAMTHTPDKDEFSEQSEQLRKTFGKSLVLRHDLPKGTQLAACHFQAKKPGTGIPARNIFDVVGRQLQRNILAGDFLSEDMLD